MAPLSLLIHRVTGGSFGAQYAIAGVIYIASGLWYSKTLSLRHAYDKRKRRKPAPLFSADFRRAPCCAHALTLCCGRRRVLLAEREAAGPK